MKKHINDLQNTLHSKIPISKKMGIKVKKYTGTKLILESPLDRNQNHKLTAFGGSIYSLMVLTGWSMIYLVLKKHNIDAQIVVKSSTINYLKPVTSDMKSSTEITMENIEKFVNRFNRKHIARVHLDVEIKNKGNFLVKMSAEYVII